MIKSYIVIFASLLLFAFSCQGKNVENKTIMKCLIHPTGITSETYLIQIFEDGLFDITYGIKSSGFEKVDFDSIVKKQSTMLKESDLKTIMDLQSQIMRLKEVEKTVAKKGGWEIILLTAEKKYHFYYGEQKDTPLGKLIEILKQISPIKIDTHSWS